MSENTFLAGARVLVATMTLLSRELEKMPKPYSLWYTQARSQDIMEVARLVASGQAQVLWVDESHPAYGLALYQPQVLESELLGYFSARLSGPWLVEPEASERQKLTRVLAVKARELAKASRCRFLSIKTGQDPAVIRGLGQEGFEVAEISARFTGALTADESEPESYSGLVFKEPEPFETEAWLDSLGELFYDGHHQHGPFLPKTLSASLWRKVILKLLGQDQPSLFLYDLRKGRVVAFCLAEVRGLDSFLSVIHVSEERRNEGLGRFMMREFKKKLYSLGARKIFVETAAYNLPALAMYQSLNLAPATPLITLHREIEL